MTIDGAIYILLAIFVLDCLFFYCGGFSDIISTGSLDKSETP